MRGTDRAGMGASELMITKFSRLVRRWDWLLLAALAPALILTDSPPAWALPALLLVLGLQAWAWGEALPVTPLNPALLLLALMAALSIFVTPDILGSLGKIAGLLFGLAVYFSAARHTRTPQGWRGALILFALAGMGVALLGLADTKWFTTKITALNALTARLPVRLQGVLPGAEGGIHPNELAGTLLWVIPVLLLAVLALASEPGWFSGKNERAVLRFGQLTGWTFLFITALLLCTGVLFLSQSRGGYLALALAGLMLLVLIPRWPVRWGSIGLLAAAVVGSLVLVSQVGLAAVLGQVTDGLSIDESAYSLNSLNGRVEIWSRAVWAIQDVPLTGLGMNIFRSGVHLLYPAFEVSSKLDLGHAHNELLQAALDLGLPGMVGFLALYVGALGMLVAVIRSGGTRRLLALGLLGGLLAHFVFGMADAVALGARPGFLFWWLLAMSFGLYDQSRPVRET